MDVEGAVGGVHRVMTDTTRIYFLCTFYICLERRCVAPRGGVVSSSPDGFDPCQTRRTCLVPDMGERPCTSRLKYELPRSKPYRHHVTSPPNRLNVMKKFHRRQMVLRRTKRDVHVYVV